MITFEFGCSQIEFTELLLTVGCSQIEFTELLLTVVIGYIPENLASFKGLFVDAFQRV